MDVGMSLRHALIGLLAEQPASGWDLSKRFEEVLGSVWPAGHPQIYGELRKLQEEELIEVDSEGPRGRKAYRPTDAGIAEVRRWLTSTETDHTMRLEPLLRSVFFWLMTPEELAAHLEREAAYYRAMAAGLRELAAAKDRGDFGYGPQTRSLRIAVEAGIKVNDALAEWADWAKDMELPGAHMPLPRSLARLNRVGLNRLTTRLFPWLPGFGVVIHRGRRSGREYQTPVNVFRGDGEVRIALTYGPDSDWVKNVLAAGGCRLRTRGRYLDLVDPRLVHDPERGGIRSPERTMLGLAGVNDFLDSRVSPDR
jgi:deazaflavin-dependent oxidoreductase (nitroreductase family)